MGTHNELWCTAVDSISSIEVEKQTLLDFRTPGKYKRRIPIFKAEPAVAERNTHVQFLFANILLCLTSFLQVESNVVVGFL